VAIICFHKRLFDKGMFARCNAQRSTSLVDKKLCPFELLLLRLETNSFSADGSFLVVLVVKPVAS
jgi:hypothetical protein